MKLHLHWNGESNIWLLKDRQQNSTRLRDYQVDPYGSSSSSQTHVRLLLTWNEGAYSRSNKGHELDEENKEDVDGFARLLQSCQPYRVDVDGEAFLNHILPLWMHLAFIHISTTLQTLSYDSISPDSFEPSFSIECLRLQSWPYLPSLLGELISCQYLHMHDIRTSMDLNFLAAWLIDSGRPAHQLRCLSIRLSDPFPYEEAIDRVWLALGGSRVFEALEYLEMKQNMRTKIDKALINCPHLIGLVLIDPWGTSLDRLLNLCTESRLKQLCMVDLTTYRLPHYGPAIYDTFANGAQNTTVPYLSSDLFSPVHLLHALQSNKSKFYDHSILEHIVTDVEVAEFKHFVFRKRYYVAEWKKVCFWIAWCRANGSHAFCLSGLPLIKLILELSSSLHSFRPLMFPAVPEKKKPRRNVK